MAVALPCYYFSYFWPTVLKSGCIANFDFDLILIEFGISRHQQPPFIINSIFVSRDQLALVPGPSLSGLYSHVPGPHGRTAQQLCGSTGVRGIMGMGSVCTASYS